MAELIKSDLEFILEQIWIAEAHAAGADLTSLLPNVQVPFGLRTVDGTFNNLVSGQNGFGSADTTFPRLAAPVFRNEGDDTFGPVTNNNYALNGNVVDADPRLISNLIVDQTPNNPAAVAAAAATPGSGIVVSPGLDGIFGNAGDTNVEFIPNVTPDVGLSAPFNSWFTFFGQFFDHGLDLVTKGGNGTVFIPLQPGDPLFVAGSPTNFMVLTRATTLAVHPGPDGVLGTSDDIRDNENTTSPFVDQNQTYTSHPSHQVFLRAYEFNIAGDPVATGKLIVNRNLGADGRFGGTGANADTVLDGMATWRVVKAQARDLLGIQLTDADVDNVPLLATDQYGNFIPGPNGFPMVMMKGLDGISGTTDDFLVEGNPAANGGLGISIVNAVRTGHQFLIDIAHNAVPVFNNIGQLVPDADTVAGNVIPVDAFGNNLAYDNELLDAHYIAGDGRANENIGLTTVHHMFHSEHNRQVDRIKATLLADATATNNVAFLNEWLTTDVATVPVNPSALVWDGERLFQAAKFATEMQYQHLVFEEFARTMQPQVDAFLAPSGYDTTINPAIVAEFAHTVFRLGHSMLTETIDRLDPTFVSSEIGLIAAFLNPLAFAASGPTPAQAAGAIVRGVTRQVGNELDEFVTEAVRNNLLGLPLDLAVLNLARGRDTGIPPLNAARREFYQMTGDSQLMPYTSWADFVQHMKHPESLINFIAAYGTHASITSATTLADKRNAATLLVFGGAGEPVDRLDFLYSTGVWASDLSPNPLHPKDADGVTTTGLGSIDFWVGGLAEEQMPFGGLLGSTFNFVFETQLEALQDGDRFYYLARNAGLNFLTELENNSFAKLVMLNTDVTHLPAAIFSTPAFTLEVDQTKQFTGLGGDGRADPAGNSILLTPLVIRNNPATPGPDANYLQYTGEDHVVLGGTPGNDIIVSSIGDDTLYGDAGNDRLEGGDGNDEILGGAGDDIITDLGGDDILHGDDGNDVIHPGNSTAAGFNLVLGGAGSDFIITTEDISEIFGGPGNDFLLGAKVNAAMTGNEGDDWIEKGTQDGAPGDNFSPLLQDDVRGNDVFIGGGGFDEFIGEGGDDIFVGSDAQDKMDGMSGFDWVTYKNDHFGVTVDLTLAALGGVGEVADHIALPLAASPSSILDRFAEVEGLSGSAFSDILRGDDVNAITIVNHGGATGGVLTNIALINGLQELLGAGVTSFGTGNIILGGDGSDIIEGRGGDDLIDGDRYLNVRISVHSGFNAAGPTGPEIATFDSMAHPTLLHNMLNGVWNPGQLQVVREILPGHGGFDTANFAGNRADYTVIINNNGTPLVFSDDIVTVTDNSVRQVDGTDRLTHMERLQFADQSVVLVPGLNAEPVGALTIRDALTNALDNTPTEGQLLRVSIAGVTDANNPGGVITGSVAYVWQVELNPGTGVFSDIIDLPAGDLAFQSANGTVFRVTADLAGLALRVKAVYQDAHGVTEQVFSAPTAPVIDVVTPVVTTVTAGGNEVTAGGAGVHLIRSDLDFILDQIRIAEHHAAGEDLLSLVPNVRAPYGLRTVDGSFNNLINFGGTNTTEFGAADNVFPRLTEPVFRPAEAITFDPDGPGGQAVGQSTSYAQTSGAVFDSQPRTISNLIVDQTAHNPAAVVAAAANPGAEVIAAPGFDGIFGTADDRDVFFIPNVAPDVGLSAPFNAWFTFFGQFFDHGLDLVTKGGNGTVFIPLKADDPLVAGPDGIFGNADDLAPSLRFMVETRATLLPGPDGIRGTADDIHEHENTTSPFVDQNQTYTSHPSHQVFLRAYALVDLPGDGLGAVPVDTGKLIENRGAGGDGQLFTADDTSIGGMATWAVVKAQAAKLLGIQLTDKDFDNVPLLATDLYGNFIPGPDGRPQVVMPGNVLVEGNPAANGGLGISVVNAVRTGHQFLIDVAHFANPFNDRGVALTPDADNVINSTTTPPPPGTYDNELLDAHYMAGDGRVNENIGLTAVHAIFHSEHNRLVDQAKQTILASEASTPGYINDWLAPGFVFTPGMTAAQVQWNGERLFQTAKFGTEMQYQHLVFEEFARTVQPMIDPFFAPTQVYDTGLDPSIVAEFAHQVYRLGHSMLNETVDRFDPAFNTVGGDHQLGLIAAFLNPLSYATSGPTPEQATGAIVRGLTREVGNEIDEFVTETLRNNLLGLPLDLPVLNLARGRDTGIPPLNAARRQFYDMTGDSQLKPYTSWADFVQHLRHPESLINFIAAYGTHSALIAADVNTLAEKRAVATALVLGGSAVINAGAGATQRTFTANEADRLAFLNSTGIYSSNPTTGATTTGVDAIDLWIGGLAEEQMPFGGLLGSTFNFVFENQLESLQDGDRFYYLERTAGLNFNTELENNSFAKLIMANTDAVHLPGLVFKTPAFTFEVDKTHQFNPNVVNNPGPNGILGDNPLTPLVDESADDIATPREDPLGGTLLTPLVIRDNPATVNTATTGPDTNYLQYTGEDHVVLGGTAGNDIIRSSVGDDTLYGDAGNDRLEGGDGNDFLFGNAGDDILTDTGGDDNIQGGDGNDVIQGGNGINLILGGFGSDFIVTGEDASEAFGGMGNDFILGSKANEQDIGNEGDDWIEAGTSDGAPGDNFDPLGLDPIRGNDVYIGRGENDKFNSEGGDDIMVGSTGLGDRYIGGSGYDWATFKDDAFGVTIDFIDRFFDQPPVPGSGASALARFDIVEGLSGSAFGDVLSGDNVDAAALAVAGAQGSVLTNIALIDGLQELLGPGVTFFDGGNIILGGEGSDILEGRGGDDLIDGDAWLNVRISVRANNDGTGAEIKTFDSMEPMIPFMVNGTYNPGQLRIVREILYADGPDFDTAKFSGSMADYSVTFDGDIVTVADNVGSDGTDRLTHIERVQFSDQALLLGGLNSEPDHLLTISDATPSEDQLLTVSIAGVTDADNISATNPTGAITGPVAYFWQTEVAPGVFEDITVFSAGEAARAEGLTFRLGDDEVGLALRVRAVYKDANDVLEEVFSAPTAPVANVNDAPTGRPTISDTTPTETLALTASTLSIADADGLTTAVFTHQWQQATTTGVGGGAAGFTNIAGATTETFTPTQAQVNRELRVVVSYTDDQGTAETVTSVPTTVTGDFIPANAAAQILTGTEGQDIIFGGGGADLLTGLGEDDLLDGGTGDDLLNAGAGNDTLTGGTGNDTLNGGVGNDTLNYTMGDGADAVDGGADADTLRITGAAGTVNETLDVLFNGTVLTAFEGSTVLTGIEAVTADLGGGTDTLSYVGTTANVTVNLAAGSAAGFTLIANIENVTSGAGNDILTGSAGANTLNGGAGDDRFIARVGDGNDTYTGGAGVDTYDLSLTTAGATVTTTSATSTDIGTDTLASIENIVGSQGNDTITLNGNVNVIDGQGGDDTINAGGGNDTLSGGLGNDTLSGGTGNDTLSGGLGNDTLNYTMGDGADAVDGGADADTLRITGAAGTVNETLDVLFNGTVLTAFEGSTALTNVEAVTADLGGGTDTLSYVGTTTNVTVNLTTGAASGFSSPSATPPLLNIENVTSGSGNDTLTGSAGANALNGGAGDDRFIATIGDGNDTYTGGVGTDTYDLSLTAANATVTTSTATSTQTGTDTLVSIENIIGSQGSDTITLNGNANVIDGQGGNDTINAGGANDTLLGGLGTDTLNGGAGTDTLTGGADNDTFVFTTPGEAGTGATRDVITDFQGAGVAGGDVIDVNAIDANTGAAGNQNFTFIGTATFTAAGQVRYFQDIPNGLTILEGNVTGTTGAEFQIALAGLHTPLAGDFTL